MYLEGKKLHLTCPELSAIIGSNEELIFNGDIIEVNSELLNTFLRKYKVLRETIRIKTSTVQSEGYH